ncbi:MAG: penicillin-binding transpeptidase domain-containing protein [Patescibacteria group bacterium]|nr:penicillin-binding transpeptidase domain-containing protein [Patescibacteria group bacterium]
MATLFPKKKSLNYFSTEKPSRPVADFELRKINQFSFFLFFLFMTFFSLFLIARLFQLTIVKGSYYQELAQKNRIRELIIEPERGEIVDRQGLTLARNEKIDISRLKIPKKDQERFFSRRVYYYPQETAHLLGYRQLAGENDLKNDLCLTKLFPGDKVGKKGIENLFDCDLRGIPGKKLIETDASGNFLRTLGIISPTPGKRLQLTIDIQLQRKVFELVKEKKAAVIASIPQTGEVLALVSSPTFSSQDFEDSQIKKIKNYLQNEDQPLLNRALQGNYPPGSVFKMIVGIAGLEEKAINEKTTFEDKGIITRGNLTFGNWFFLQYGKTDGLVDIVKAIKRSNDIFFYLASEKIGPAKIKIWAERLGLGKKTNIGLEESEGLIPTEFWKETVLKEKWYDGDTFNLSIGQGYLLATPIQINYSSAVFANNGYYCQPLLLKNQKPSCQKLPIVKKNLEIIKRGMKEACLPGGTGWPFFEFKIKDSEGELKRITAGCKTGTAESSGKDQKPHAWITVFAPFDNPEIIVTVLVEEGGQGSDVAGPVAKEILTEYFEKTR